MRFPPWLQLCWRGTRCCSHCACTIALWTLWLLLGVTLVLQVRVAFARELTVPAFLLRAVEERLAASGLNPRFGEARFDPSGRVLLRDLTLHDTGFDEPLLTAAGLSLRLYPWLLPLGRVEVQHLEIIDAHLHVPAMLSPSGRADPVISRLHAHLDLADLPTLHLTHLDAHLGDIPLTATGTWTLPPPPATPQTDLLTRARRLYGPAIRDLARALATLPPHTAPTAHLTVNPTHARLAVSLESLTWPARDAAATGLRAQLDVSLTPGPRPATWQLDLTAAHLAAPPHGQAAQLRLTNSGTFQPTPFALRPGPARLDLATLDITSLFLTDLTTTADLAAWPHVALAGHTRLADRPWAFTAAGDPTTRAGRVSVAGELPHAVMRWLGARTGLDLAHLLTFDTSPWLETTVDLAPGGHPTVASGRFATAAVVARRVPLDRTAARFTWDAASGRAFVDDIILATGPSLATGSYAMDTRTRDFRFLLDGALHPAAINNWFRAWWPNFWSNFGFPADLPPGASIDIRGRWGAPRLTEVFVRADSPAALKGVPFDRLRTRLFIRPGFTDALAFRIERGATANAAGTFRRSWDLAARAARWTEFDIASSLSLADLAGLFPETGPALIAPFDFSTPPTIQAQGRFGGPADDTGRPRLDLKLTGEVTGPWRFYDFPLEGLAFTARQLNDKLAIREALVGFAGGLATGTIELSGPSTDRRLAFDGALEQAALGDAIRQVELWATRRRDEPTLPVSRFQSRNAAGRLNLALTAEGPLADPFGFRGEGHVTITEAALAEVNLLGLLSTLLRRTLLDYSTLELDAARANFDLSGSRLIFSQLSITGPRAAIDASGDYRLDTKTLDFNAKILPFDSSRGLVGSTLGLVLSPLSSVLEVRLTGPLASPAWAFAYGPTSILRALTGNPATPAPLDPALSPTTPFAPPAP